MVGTISLMVHGERRRRVIPATPWMHLLGTLLGSLAVAVVLAGTGGLLKRTVLDLQSWPTAPILLSTVAAAYALRELDLLPLPILGSARAVPSSWRLTMNPRRAALLYGLLLGVGFGTTIPSTSFYVVASSAVVAPSLAYALVPFVGYALGRALPVVAFALTSPERASVAFRLHPYAVLMHLANGVAMVLGAAFIVGNLVL